MVIWYVYPRWHKVSFSLIAEKHVRELKKYMWITEIDEMALPMIYPHSKPLIILHPLFYPMVRFGKRITSFMSKIRGIIGVDVADSDRVSTLAVSITNYCEAIIVPSKWARDSYVNSGVTVPVHVVPHGLDDEYFTKSKGFERFKKLAEMKRRKNYKYLLFFCWHSPWRKGMDLVFKVYKRVRERRKDVVLIVKAMNIDANLNKALSSLGGIAITGWLSEEEKIELYDLCDVYLLFSRGGGFELNGLEALARGEVVIAPNRGAWTDYLPDFSLVKSRTCPYVLKDNPIHCGKGVEIDVDKAVKKVLKVIKEIDDYKVKVRKYVEEEIKEKYTWDRVGKELVSVIRKYV